MEIWRTINGYENYQVSNLGNVKNISTGKLLKPRVNKKTGYVLIDIRNGGNKKTIGIHRLVALTFIENDNPENKTQVNHIDENKTNNNVNNLEWCTPSYNINYGSHNERVKQTKKENPRIFTEEERRRISERTSGENHWNYGQQWNEETKNKNMLSQQNRKRVRCVETGEVFESIRAAARAYDVIKSRISDAITHRNRVQTCAGYHWEVV